MKNPFNDYGYDLRVFFKSIPEQRNAKYTQPRETVEQFKTIDTFFSQKYGVSPNIAHICGIDCPKTEPSRPSKEYVLAKDEDFELMEDPEGGGGTGVTSGRQKR